MYCDASSAPVQETVIGASILLGTVIPYLTQDKLHGGVMPYLIYIHESFYSAGSEYCFVCFFVSFLTALSLLNGNCF